MAQTLKDKILGAFGMVYYCEKCGTLFAGKKYADDHEKKCKGA